MVAAVHGGPISIRASRDDEGYREYLVSHLVQCAITDGPYDIMSASGLPTVGSPMNLLGTTDPWAYCYPTMGVSRHSGKDHHPGQWWRVDQKFSNKPMKRCNTESIEDPLAEPDVLSGSFVRHMREISKDRFGNYIRTSSHEAIRGSLVEFDSSEPTVRVEQNVSSLDLSTLASMIDHVNDATLWGMAPRHVKLSGIGWERKLYGVCTYYYTRVFDFEVSYQGFDRQAIDEGNKVLNGHWDKTTREWTLDNIDGAPPDPDNPTHFIRYKDINDEPCRVILDGSGRPASTRVVSGTSSGTTGGAGQIDIEHYPEANFLLLGIPSSL